MNNLDWIYFLVVSLIGLIPAAIASRKGRDFLTWWVFGGLFFLAALPASLLIKPGLAELENFPLQQANLVECPFCAGLNQQGTMHCRFCGSGMAACSILLQG